MEHGLKGFRVWLVKFAGSGASDAAPVARSDAEGWSRRRGRGGGAGARGSLMQFLVFLALVLWQLHLRLGAGPSRRLRHEELMRDGPIWGGGGGC